jgi:hypothetical protein
MTFSGYGGFPIEPLWLIWSGRISPKRDMAQPFRAVRFAIWCLRVALCVENTILQTWKSDGWDLSIPFLSSPDVRTGAGAGAKKEYGGKFGWGIL